MPPPPLTACVPQAWLNEKFAPELLESKAEIVECVVEQLDHMVGPANGAPAPLGAPRLRAPGWGLQGGTGGSRGRVWCPCVQEDLTRCALLGI